MSRSICRNCGSDSFRADRALAGRLVCTKCGTPMGDFDNRKIRNLVNKKNIFRKRNILILIGLIAFFLVLI